LLWTTVPTLVVLMVVGALVPVILSTEWARRRIERAIEARCEGVYVHLGELSFSWTGPQRAASIEFDPDGGGRILRASDIAVHGGLPDLVYGTERVTVTAQRADLGVVRHRDGRLNLERLFVGGDDDNSAPQPREVDVSVENGVLIYVDESAQQTYRCVGHRWKVEYRSDRVHVRAEPGAAGAVVGERPGFVAMQGVAEVLDAIAPVTTLDLTIALGDGPARIENSLLHLEGGLDFDGLSIAEATTQFSFADGVLELSEPTVLADRGRLVGKSVRIDFNGPKPQWSTRFTVDRVPATVDLTPVLAYAFPFLSLDERRGAIEGEIRGEISIDGTGFDREDLEESLKASGTLTVADGFFRGSHAIGELAEVIGENFDEVLFTKLSSTFEVGAGQVRTRDVRIETKPGSKIRNLGFQGVVDFDRALDYGVDLAALEATIGDREIRRILGDARRALGDGGFPARLRGTLEEPELSITTELQGLLEEPERIEGLIDFGVERALDELFDSMKRREEKKRRRRTTR